jgi:hypothetical protein
MAQDALRYDRMVQDALRSVVRRALAEVAKTGVPGAHHFYVTFKTAYPGIGIADHLKATYPDEMTIVLQHQFYGLEVSEEEFQVTLSFNRTLERLRIPFAAITAFVDPSVNFGLQFQVETGAPDAIQTVPPAINGRGRAAASAPAKTEEPESADPEAPAEKVVSLDAFRKK